MNSSDEFEVFFFGTTTSNPFEANLTVLGIPWDTSSTYRKGASKAPTSIRQATSARLFNPYTETQVNLIDKWQIFDAGDVEPTNKDVINTRDTILGKINEFRDKMNIKRFLFLGGDHLATFFGFYALSKSKIINAEKTGIIYLDAHPDLYDNYEGEYSHACVLRRILDLTDLQPSNIVQVGIRAPTPPQLDYARDTGIKIISCKEFQTIGPTETAINIKDFFNNKIENVYLSIDLDVLDPSYAPGIGNPQPGGLSTREVIEFIHGLTGLNVQAFDIVELCPAYDHSGITAFVAAKLIQEVLGIVDII
ncbi:MAG: agmatinase [Candidatus Hodarchaeales archaeon]